MEILCGNQTSNRLQCNNPINYHTLEQVFHPAQILNMRLRGYLHNILHRKLAINHTRLSRKRSHQFKIYYPRHLMSSYRPSHRKRPISPHHPFRRIQRKTLYSVQSPRLWSHRHSS